MSDDLAINDARKIIYGLFDAGWSALDPPLPYVAENESGIAPEDGSAYAQLRVQHTTSQQATIGRAPKWRRGAFVMINVYTPADAGMAAADALCTVIRGIFEGVRSGGVVFGAVLVQEAIPDGRWMNTLVQVPFNYHETH